MVDVRGRFFGLPHGTTPAAVTTNKNIKTRFFKSSEPRNLPRGPARIPIPFPRNPR